MHSKNEKIYDANSLSDPDLFCEMVHQHGPTIRAWLGRHLWDHAVVNDLAQETFVAAWDSLERYDGKSSLAAWLTGIARNRLRNYYRSTQRRSSAMERYQDQLLTLLGGKDIDNKSSLQALGQCIEKLPERSKEMIKARYFGAQSVAELARSQNLQTNAVSQLLFRVRDNLKQCIRENS